MRQLYEIEPSMILIDCFQYLIPCMYLIVEDLDCLHDDAAGNDGVGGGDCGDDVPSHTLHLKPG